MYSRIIVLILINLQINYAVGQQGICPKTRIVTKFRSKEYTVSYWETYKKRCHIVKLCTRKRIAWRLEPRFEISTFPVTVIRDKICNKNKI